MLEKANRQKVLEVEKLSHTISELEESILATGEVANAVHFYQNQVAKLKVSAVLERTQFICWIPSICCLFRRYYNL